VLPDHLDAIVDRSSWRPQPIFDLVARMGQVDPTEMESTFNLGVGMFAVVGTHDADRALALLAGRGVDAWIAGEIIDGAGAVRLHGSHTHD
jgi:phosphoribosylformylglycinamidine cyclo-ligase